MYSFQAGAGRRKNRQLVQLLCVVIFILIIALISVAFSYFKVSGVSDATSEALFSRALSEAAEAQNAVYRLTQSSGTNTAPLLAAVRSHIYAMQCLNTVASNIYGAGTVITEAELLSDCIDTLDQCDTRLQAGSVLSDLYTTLRDQVDAVVGSFASIL